MSRSAATGILALTAVIALVIIALVTGLVSFGTGQAGEYGLSAGTNSTYCSADAGHWAITFSCEHAN